ncbi:MAG: NUDIX domain-containing protein [Deltaproteobacteria bacterium]|nr:NUDIX domain-containing protein [Deltaproteobacteria bacterium]
MPIDQKPKVGIGIMIFRDGKILLGKRRSSHGDREFAFPGGHLEHMESFHHCAIREIAEETGIKVTNIRFQFLLNLLDYAPKHYVHIGLVADWQEGEAQLLEPDKCSGWDWYSMDNLPQPLFVACERSVDCYRNGDNYLDSDATGAPN